MGMKKVCEACSENDFALEERNLLSVAYKNVVGARRASLRIIGSIESKEQSKDGPNLSLVKGYKAKVEDELQTICFDILNLLDSNLIKDTLLAEPKVFYQKMKADYYRYLAEFAVNEIKSDHSAKAKDSYGQATAAASALAPPPPIRLGLALNYSVFMYEVQGQQQ